LVEYTPPRVEATITRLAAGQALGTLLGVREGAAGLRDAVDPGLQLRRDREVVHRRADDDDVGGEELADQLLGDRVRMLESMWSSFISITFCVAVGAQLAGGCENSIFGSSGR
jgi:hypothetical protein